MQHCWLANLPDRRVSGELQKVEEQCRCLESMIDLQSLVTSAGLHVVRASSSFFPWSSRQASPSKARCQAAAFKVFILKFKEVSPSAIPPRAWV